MFRTRSLSALFIFLLVASVLVGCGGDSSSPSTPSPYAGHWKGTWVDSIWGQTGTLDITVSGRGNITGSVVNNDNDSGTVSGRIGNSGGIACYYDYRWAAYRVTGLLSINASDHLVGNVSEYDDVFNIEVRKDSVDLIKQ
jgi:hypothetical protein